MGQAVKAQTSPFARSRARELRRASTDCERMLWQRLRANQLGAKFRRQHPFEQFILDFVCLERRVIVELDGGHHQDVASKDHERTTHLMQAGFQVIRFWNHEVIEEMDVVLEVIHRALHPEARALSVVTHPLPNPPLEGEGTTDSPVSLGPQTDRAQP
jgi:very-short-patch-repair endonuclease